MTALVWLTNVSQVNVAEFEQPHHLLLEDMAQDHNFGRQIQLSPAQSSPVKIINTELQMQSLETLLYSVTNTLV